MVWEIVHVPDKVPGLEESTVNVLASNVEPKLANTIMRQLSLVAPLENLRHVKRIRRKPTTGKSELSIVLCPSFGNENELGSIPDDVQKLINDYHLSPFTAKVYKYAATSKEEWEEQCKLWPTSYHPMVNVNCVTGFSEEDSQWIISCMKTTLSFELFLCLDLTLQGLNAALIVDPASRQLIASAVDQTPVTLESFFPENGGDEAENFGRLFQVYTSDESAEALSSVSCLQPWSWPQQCPQDLPWHPLKHAPVVAIESSAARDRQLFPLHDLNPSSAFHPRGRGQRSHRPYLCTGFDIYLAWEPCAMCAMALVHQRVRRIFFAFPNPNAGALGSVHRLQGERSLNHHYSVFRVSAS
ncbi:unnamed protein product [Spirodela intermedia]|uniref:Uncharacterized protein n=1 Tax=Spirodela intermedia TaxID=51605 RepID=A0A7I8IZ22_SPIIN|nr:unnamed protein product [Spirodela intermedia]CAA6662272.1 unnamed protein product [Spirodela intermedia]